MFLMNLAGLREIETQADMGALEYVSLNTVLEWQATLTGYDWLFHNHATRNKILRKLKK